MTKRPKRIGTPVKPAWQELCRSQDAWTVRELAFLCCGWNPSVTEVPDLAEYNQAVDMINRAVRVRALETIDNLAWPGTDAERMYDGVPAFSRQRRLRGLLGSFLVDSCTAPMGSPWILACEVPSMPSSRP